MAQNVGANNHTVPPEYIFSLRLRSAGAVKRQFDGVLAGKEANYKADAPNAQDLAAQIRYFRMLSELYEKNMNLMDSVVAYLNNEIAHGRKSEEELSRWYGQLIKWLENMEKEMRRVLGLPTSEFAQMIAVLARTLQALLDDLRTSFATRPKTYGAAIGGVGVAVLLHKYFTEICMAGKVFAKLGLVSVECGACAQVGWVAAFGCGALGGVFLVVAIKAVCHAFSPEEYGLQEEIGSNFQEVQHEVEMVKQALRSCNDEDMLREMRAIIAVWNHFENFDPSVDENTCSICLNPPRQPVLFSGCLGRHFHCSVCRDEALANHSGGGRCPVCRGPPFR